MADLEGAAGPNLSEIAQVEFLVVIVRHVLYNTG
jgi:hypothetical protein